MKIIEEIIETNNKMKIVVGFFLSDVIVLWCTYTDQRTKFSVRREKFQAFVATDVEGCQCSVVSFVEYT